ncbi:putative 2,3-dimethylmalate lyase [Dioscorea sansibarensis]
MDFTSLLPRSQSSALFPLAVSAPSSTSSPHGRSSLPLVSSFKAQRLLSWSRSSLPWRSHGVRFSSLGCKAAAAEPPARALRRILESPGVFLGPACFDALSAKLVEKAGFQYCFTSGFSISAARLGLPDVGLISYGEMLDQGHNITLAVSIPVIGDGDNGHGNAMNVKRTVKGFIQAGFAGILLEDQVSPKACGHTRGRKVVSREEAVMHIKAALDAREESGSDIVIIARTDSRQAISLEEALWRSRAFADAGADALFIDALASIEEMKAFCEITPLLPKVASMLEGGGKTPILSPIELEEIGFKLVAYPLSLIGVSIRAMEDALVAIKGGRVPPPGQLPTFEEIKDIVGFNDYYKEEELYSVSSAQTSSQRSYFSARSTSGEGTEQNAEKPYQPDVEVLAPYASNSSRSNDPGGRLAGIWSRTLRIKITGRDGLEKLDIRIPAGFLEGISNIIPGLGGRNIIEMLEDASVDVNDGTERGKVLLDFNDTMGDRIQVFVE